MEERTGDCGKNLGRSVAGGERPIEFGYSWFSAKTIEVVRYILFLHGKALRIIQTINV